MYIHSIPHGYHDTQCQPVLSKEVCMRMVSLETQISEGETSETHQQLIIRHRYLLIKLLDKLHICPLNIYSVFWRDRNVVFVLWIPAIAINNHFATGSHMLGMRMLVGVNHGLLNANTLYLGSIISLSHGIYSIVGCINIGWSLFWYEWRAHVLYEEDFNW